MNLGIRDFSRAQISERVLPKTGSAKLLIIFVYEIYSYLRLYIPLSRRDSIEGRERKNLRSRSIIVAFAGGLLSKVAFSTVGMKWSSESAENIKIY
jgi:hypothetical protein